MAIAATPSNFYVQEGNGQVYLSWDIVAGAVTYSVQRSTDGISFTEVATPAVPEYLDTSVTLATKYFYKVASVNADGTSPYTYAQTVIPTGTADLALGQIRLMAQQKADMVGSNFISLPEWNMYINQSYFELYDLLTTDYEDYFLAPPLLITTDGVTNQYDLPNGTNYQGAPAFYKLVGVDCGLDNANNAWVTLNKFNFIDRNKFVFPNIGSSFMGVFSMQYRLMGNSLYLIPTPSANQILRVWYQPRLNQLLKDTDVVDGVSGWTEYIIVDAAIKAVMKEESDPTALYMQKKDLIKRIEESSMNRDMSQPSTISDTRSSQRWGRGTGPNGNGPSGGW